MIWTFRQGSPAEDFPLLADLIEQLESEGALARTLPDLRVAEVLAGMHGVGPRRAATVLRDAELPAEVRFEDLGPGDIERLSRTLHVLASGIPREPIGGEAGGSADRWPKHAGPADFTPEEKQQRDAQLRPEMIRSSRRRTG